MDYESLVGTLFAGRFLIEKLLGKGGMGAVYLGEHDVLQRKFAIKVIRKNLLADLSIASRFRREARAASRIDHPHVTYVFDYGHSEDGIPYLAMEFVKGPSLQDEIERDKPFPVKRGLHVLYQIAQALTAAHAMQVVHRDLKPQNIVLTKHGEDPDFVKVLDFGLAKIIGAPTSGMATKHGDLIGTPHYMSPEQYTEGQVDHRSDIYSFGVLAYELFVGEVPFEGTVMEIMTSHIQKEPPVPSEMAERNDFPGQMNRIILRCLAKKPQDRFQTAVDLQSEIRSLQQIFGETTSIKHLPSAPIAGGLTKLKSDGSIAMAPTILASLISSDDEDLSETFDVDDDDPPSWTDLTDADSHAPRDVSRLRSRALEELAYTVRDLGLGSAEISHILAQKVEADEEAFELASAIALLEADAMEIDAASRVREVRLRQALSQMEHERSMLSPLDPGKTMPLAGKAIESFSGARNGRTRSGEFALHDHRFRQRIQSLEHKLQQIAGMVDEQQASLRQKLDAKIAALHEVQQEVSRCEDQLRQLIKEMRDQIEETGDPELMRLLEFSGCS
jgi:serine/threonine protein kinase